MRTLGRLPRLRPDFIRSRRRQACRPCRPMRMIIVPVRNCRAVSRHGSADLARPARSRSPRRSRPCASSGRSASCMQRDAEVAEPGPVDLHRIGTVANIVRYHHRRPTARTIIVCQGEQRVRVLDFCPARPFLVARVLDIAGADAQVRPRSRRGFLHLQQPGASRRSQLLPQAPPELVAGVPGAAERRQLWPTSRPSYMDIKPRREAGDPGDHRSSPRGWTRSRACWRNGSRCCGCQHEIGQQTRAALRRAPARGAAARADGGHPAPARRGRRQGARRSPSSTEAIAKASMPPEVEAQATQGAAPLRAHAGGRRRIRHGADLSRLAGRTALGAARGEADRHRGSAPASWTRTISASRRSSSRIIEYLAVRKLAPERQGADPVLRRPARRRQDLARPVDRPRDGAPVRARQPWRRARRGRDPRPPADLYRRAARQHHPGHPQGRLAQLRDDAGRDRQDGHAACTATRLRRCSRCSIRAEQHVPRQLSRRAVRPQPRGVHRHGQHARHHPGAAARPDGGDQPGRLHRRGEAADRRALSRPPPVRCQRHRGPSRSTISEPRAARPSSRTIRAKPACAIWSARSASVLRNAAVASPKAAAER